MTIGENIKNVRNAKKMTQKELAETIGLSRSYLGDLEKNRRNPSTKTVKKISEKLGISVFYLMTGFPNVEDSKILKTSPVLHDTESFLKDADKSTRERLIELINNESTDQNVIFGIDQFIKLQNYLKNTPDFIGYEFVKNILYSVYQTEMLINDLNNLDLDDLLNFEEYFNDSLKEINNLETDLKTALNELEKLDEFIWEQKDKFNSKQQL